MTGCIVVTVVATADAPELLHAPELLPLASNLG